MFIYCSVRACGRVCVRVGVRVCGEIRLGNLHCEVDRDKIEETIAFRRRETVMQINEKDQGKKAEKALLFNSPGKVKELSI